MSSWLSKEELKRLSPAEHAAESPVPTQIVSNGEFNPLPQTEQQKQVEARIAELSDTQAKKMGMGRREPSLAIRRLKRWVWAGACF
jgi:hypothetical protein